MQKIISLFQRNYDGDRLVRDEVTPGAEWVLQGEGSPTKKWDGACCMIQGSLFYKRYDAKKGKTPPDGFIPAQNPDPITGHWPGWLLIGDGPEDKWFREGFTNTESHILLWGGTYELVGPRINGNKQSMLKHCLIPHGNDVLGDVPRTFDGLKQWFGDNIIEGIVWHHPDGRMVKIKRKDFGLTW